MVPSVIVYKVSGVKCNKLHMRPKQKIPQNLGGVKYEKLIIKFKQVFTVQNVHIENKFCLTIILTITWTNIANKMNHYKVEKQIMEYILSGH